MIYFKPQFPAQRKKIAHKVIEDQYQQGQQTMNKLIIALLTINLIACSAANTPKNDTADKPATKTKEQENLADSLSILFGEPVKVDPAEIEKHPLGSQHNPIRVSGPAGERKYLARLICENGEPVSAFSRDGSADIGPYGSILDIYTVICDTDKGAVNHTVFMDMYHGNYKETRPAHGFKALKAEN